MSNLISYLPVRPGTLAGAIQGWGQTNMEKLQNFFRRIVYIRENFRNFQGFRDFLSLLDVGGSGSETGLEPAGEGAVF
jgi:hypothetical protein